MDWESGYVAYYRQRLKAVGISVLLYRTLKPSSIIVAALNARPARCLRGIWAACHGPVRVSGGATGRRVQRSL